MASSEASPFLNTGQTDSSNNDLVSSRPRRSCECEQCCEDGCSRELVDAIINPLEILSRRYQSAQVGGLGVWKATKRALVRKDKDGTYRIKGYVSTTVYSEFLCDLCKSLKKIHEKCENGCWDFVCRPGDASMDVVDAGSAAVVGKVLEFCPRRFRKLRKALQQVIQRLALLGARQGGHVLTKLASLLKATRAEVAFVLNNDTSLVQPIIRGANCFLRRDRRGVWDSCDKLTGAELKGQLFFIDPAGVWTMIGTGEKYGVSSKYDGNYHLEVGGQSMMYGSHLDEELFGGPVM